MNITAQLKESTREVKTMTRNEWFAKFALRLAEHHKRHCDGATCNIALANIREMAEAAGARFTEEEKREFV